MLSKKENKNENENENENEDDDIMSRNEIKELNDYLDEIDKSKSFEDQIELLKKVKNLEEYYFTNDFDDKEESEPKIFKVRLAHLSNKIDEDLFEQIIGRTLTKLADKLINTTKKEENQIIVRDINKNKDKLLERDDYDDWVIQPNDQRINLLDAIKLILNFDEDQLDLVWAFIECNSIENIKIKKWVSNFNWGKTLKFIKQFM